jgi:hypothetical protein
LRQLVPNWGNAPTYWAANIYGYYLFRQTFTLPKASDFDGSTIDLGSPAGAGNSGDPNASYAAYLNGVQVDTWQLQGLRRDAIGLDLRPGANALAIYAPPSNDLTPAGAHCDAFSFTMHIRANGSLPAPQSPPQATPLTVLLPGANAVVTGPEIPFTWRPYRGAAYYDLQLWLVKADPGQRPSNASLTTYVARLMGARFTLGNKRMLKGVYHWRMAAANAQGELISPWTPDASVTIPNV